MNTLIIKELHYKNFKMLRDFKLILADGETIIQAPNGYGKTTIFDGFSWLLFDKDSQGNKLGENIKTKVNHEYLHELEHSVSGIFDYNGEVIKLKKVFYEKWVSKRGSTEKTFDGHTTDYYIDEIKVQAKKYNEYISSIVDEDIFKLLTNPLYFNVNLDAKKRREMLFEIFGDLVSDEYVISLRSDFAIVKKILEKQTLQEAIDNNKKSLNQSVKEMDEIPGKIKENENTIFSCKPADIKKLNIEIAEKESKVSNLQLRLIELENGKALNKKINELESEKNKAEYIKLQSKGSEDIKNKALLEKAYSTVQDIKNEISDLNIKIKNKKAEIDRIELDTIPLREKKKELESYQTSIKEICDSCGSTISYDARQKFMEEKNQKIAEQLKEVKQKGLFNKRKKEEIQGEINVLVKELESQKERLAKGESFIEENSKKNELKNEDLSGNEEYQICLRNIENLKIEIKSIEEGLSEQKEVLKNKILSAKKEYENILIVKSKQDLIKIAKQRIEELKEDQSKIAEKYELLSQTQNTLEEYNILKSEIIEKSISEKFKTISFRLFDKQINGEVKPTCKTVSVDDGIAFDEGLNNGHRIIAGLDIINVFSEHYGYKLPIFIDNAESITRKLDINTQNIKLEAKPVDSLTIIGGVKAEAIPVDVKVEVQEYDDLDELF